MRMIPKTVLSFVCIAGILPACSSSEPAETARPNIVVTYSVLGSVVADLVGDAADVTTLIPDGQDPHDFQPSARDIEAINNADLVVSNGLDFEEGLEDVLASAIDSGVSVYMVGENITVREPDEDLAKEDHAEEDGHAHGAGDPHLWLSPLSFSQALPSLTAAINKATGLSIDETAAIDQLTLLDNKINEVISNIMGYNGASGTVTTYKRETIKTTPQATADSTGVSVINDSGTAGNVITFSGGWNRTDMSTQTGVTWLDGQNGIGRGVNADVISFISIDRINVCRYSRGLYLVSATDASVGSIYATACSTGGIDLGTASRAVSITNCWVNNNTTGINTAALGGIITNVKSADNNTSYGVSLNASRYCFINSVIAGNSGLAASSGASLRFNNALNCIVGTATISNSRLAGSIISTASINCAVNGGSSSGSAQGVNIGSTLAVSELYLNNFTINEATEVAAVSLWGGFVYSNRHDNTDNNSWIFQPGMGTINQQTSVIDSPATTAWQMRPTAVEAAAASPLMLKLGTVVCAASSLVTVTARMRRTNTGLTMRLVCPGGQISGVATDVITSMTAAADTWQTVTITFTPTKAGAVDIYAHAFGGTTFSGYVSNLTAAQA